MTLLLISGFEEGTTDEATTASGTSAVQSAVKRTGTYALRQNPTAAGAIYAVRSIGADGGGAEFALSTMYVTFYMRLGAVPTATVRVAVAANAAASVNAWIRMDSSGHIFLSNAAESSNSSNAATLSADGLWHLVEVKFVQNGTCTLQVDGGSSVSITGANVVLDRFQFGTGSTQTKDFYYDDLAIDDASAPGAGQCVVMLPDGAGAQTGGWTAGTGTTFAEVDDIPSDDDTTYWAASASGERSVSLASAAASGVVGSIKAIKLRSLLRCITTASGNIKAYSGAASSSTSSTALPTTYTPLRKVLPTDPNTSAAWTASGLDALELGVVTAASSAIRCTQLCVMVWSNGVAVTPSFSSAPAITYGSLTRTGPNNTPWTLTFTPSDTDTTGANALSWKVYTGALRTGTLVGSGTCTNATQKVTTLAYNASGLSAGSNTLYVSVDDGTLVSADSTVTLLRDDAAPTGATSVSVTAV
jgi:hypothetical protein